MRVVPVIPFSLFSIAAGAARVDLPTFIWTTAVGYLPLTAVFVYLGSQAREPLADRPDPARDRRSLVVGLVIGHRFRNGERNSAARGDRAAATPPQPESET